MIAHLARRIALEGPMTVADFMAEALWHPTHGYYAVRDPLGAAGDFVTAPEISQMFGELIGAWCAVLWQAMGRPDPVQLVELGPGRGTLMADVLRATARVPGFHDSLSIHLVEGGEALRERQRAVLPPTVTWHDGFESVPDGPMLLIANEFFDALPIRQFVREEVGWRERLVGTRDGKLCFVLSPSQVEAPFGREAPVGGIVEVCPSGIALAHAIGARVAAEGGAALIVDYGPARSAPGDSFQAVRDHRYHDVLEAPGTADLTAHVDFEMLARAAAEAGARCFGPVPQGAFLERLGIGARAQALATGASPAQAEGIAAAYHRLVDADAMGTLFKALAIQDAALVDPPGFS